MPTVPHEEEVRGKRTGAGTQPTCAPMPRVPPQCSHTGSLQCGRDPRLAFTPPSPLLASPRSPARVAVGKGAAGSVVRAGSCSQHWGTAAARTFVPAFIVLVGGRCLRPHHLYLGCSGPDVTACRQLNSTSASMLVVPHHEHARGRCSRSRAVRGVPSYTTAAATRPKGGA